MGSMELSCPSCETRFFVADNAIPPAGRKVRCSVCGHEWIVQPALLSETATAPARSGEAEALNLTDDDFRWPDEPATESKAPRHTTAPPPAAAAAPEVASGAHASSGTVVTGAGQSQRRSRWPLIGLILLVLIALTYAFRHDLVEAVPMLAGWFRMAGLPVSSTIDGLSVQEIQFAPTPGTNTPTVRVSGFIVNNGTAQAEIPPLEVVLMSADGATVASQSFRPPQPLLGSDRSTRFQYDISADAASVSKAEVRLGAGGE
jgi:predicted Zn finger-like uncharacterized protein